MRLTGMAHDLLQPLGLERTGNRGSVDVLQAQPQQLDSAPEPIPDEWNFLDERHNLFDFPLGLSLVGFGQIDNRL